VPHQPDIALPRAERSIAERSRNITCRQPSRTRRDDRIVELFLCTWQAGRFAKDPVWLSQESTNVEVMARDEVGNRLAVEHTRIFAFEDHKRQEELLRPIAQRLEAEDGLLGAGRHFDITFYPGFIDGLPRRLRQPYADALARWAAGTLPMLQLRPEVYRLDVPPLLQGRASATKIDVTVTERMDGIRPVAVGGRLPDDPHRMVPLIRKALRDKLPKLVAAEAESRILLLDLPTLDSDRQIIEVVREPHGTHPALAQVDFLVTAYTFGFETDHFVRFFAYRVGTYDLVDVSRVEVIPEQ
jgi:hypothetical protein